MSTTHAIRCTCGSLRGTVEPSRKVNRGLCYCKDCQAFAHYLGRPDDILDPFGGTEVIQVPPRTVSFTAGLEHLACIRLTGKGMLRWYAACCRTPIGNTLPSYKISFVGLVHSCLRAAGPAALEQSFGPLHLCANTKSALSDPGRREQGIPGAVWRILSMILRERLSGGYRRTPFFSADTGAPVVAPHVLTDAELEATRRAVREWRPEAPARREVSA